VTHCAVGTLRGFLDGELEGERLEAVQRHVADCPHCRAELAALGAGAEWAGGRLGGYARGLNPGAVEAEAAWGRMEAVWGGGAVTPRRPRAVADVGPARPGAPRPRRIWPVASGVAAALALSSLAFSPVRAAAGDVLQIFRVQQVQVVTVSAADVASIEKALQGTGQVDVQGLARVRVTPHGAATTTTLAAARQQVGFPLTAPTALPAGYALSGVRVQPPMQVDFSHLQVAAINRLLASLGSKEGLPAAVGAASIDLSVPSSAVLRYAAAGGPPIEVAETVTPTLSVPAGVDVNAVRHVLLNLPFLPPDLRSQLQSVSDWQNTAVIPQVPGVSQPVRVGGAQGAFVSSPQGGATMLIWLSGGVVRVVRGGLTLPQANAIALSMA